MRSFGIILALCSIFVACKVRTGAVGEVKEAGASSTGIPDERTKPLIAGLHPKVLTITLYEVGTVTDAIPGEAQMWATRQKLNRVYAVPGAFSPLYCNEADTTLGYKEADEHCMIITGMGSINSTASLMAVALSGVDLSRTYIMIAGIAGGNPEKVTLGSVIWANHVVDSDATYHVDGRELDNDYPSHFHLGCVPSPTRRDSKIWCNDGDLGWDTGTEHFKLNEKLVAKAAEISGRARFTDDDKAVAYRNKYAVGYPKQSDRNGIGRVQVHRCDVASGLAFFHGKRQGRWVTEWTKAWTKQKDETYCATAMEETGAATVMTRLSAVGVLDFNRFMVVRGITNFDRQDVDAREADNYAAPLRSLRVVATPNGSGALPMALENVFLAGMAVTKEILSNWSIWENGVP